MNPVAKTIQNMINKIEKNLVDYHEICGNYDFWEDGVHSAMLFVKDKPPFDHSFDEYDTEWFKENKDAFVQWLKVLADGIAEYPYLEDDDDLQENALELLKKTFPDAVVTHQNPHAGEFSVEFEDGRYGWCGFANGDLGCDIYPSEEEMALGDPKEQITVAFVNRNEPEEEEEQEEGADHSSEPLSCPKCKSENISAHGFDVDAGTAWRKVDCEDCGTTWTETFHFHSWDYED